MRRTLLIILVLAGILMPRLAAAHEATGNPHKDLYDLNSHIEEAMIAIAAGDVAKARAEYTHFDEGWLKIEDGVREYSKQSYRDIERAMTDVKLALKQEPLDPAAATSALEALVAADDAFIDTAGAAITSSGQQLTNAPITLASELPKLDEALDALTTGDLRYARAEIEEFRTVWPEIKDVVASNDSAAYARAEQLQAQASAQISSAQIQAAIVTVGELKQTLMPFTTATQTSTVADAISALLREGLEALLLVLGIGAVVLVAICGVMLSQGKRISRNLLLQVASMLVWIFGFKFIGSGIQALQMARMVPETNIGWLPTFDLLGIYPTWQTTLPQLALLVLAIVVLWSRSHARHIAQINVPANS